MEITVKISDTFIKQALLTHIKNEIHECFDDEVIKAAKLPKAADVVKELMSDAKFMATVQKTMASGLDEIVEENFYNDLYDISIPAITKMYEKCEAVAAEVYDQKREKEEAARKKVKQQIQTQQQTELVNLVVETLVKRGLIRA